MLRRLLVVMILLAGCADGPSPGGPPPATDVGPMTSSHNLTFIDEPRFVTDNVTGTFQPADTPPLQAVVGRAGQPQTGVQQIDVTQHFDQGAATWVRLDVLRPTAGTVLVWLGAEEPAAIRTSACQGCNQGAGTVWEGAVVPGNGAITVSVWYLGGEPQAIDYQVQIQTTATPAWIPSGISLGIDMPANSTVTFQGFGGTTTDIMVFGPDDSYLGLLPAANTVEWTLDGDAGEYVFHPVGHGQRLSIQVATSQSPATARLLGQEIRSEGPHAAVENTVLTFEVDRKPLQMGVAYFGFASMDASVRLEAPGGDTLEIGQPGLAAGGTGGFAQTVMGLPALGPGTYTLTWEDTLNDGSMQVQEFFAFYTR